MCQLLLKQNADAQRLSKRGPDKLCFWGAPVAHEGKPLQRMAELGNSDLDRQCII